MPIMWRTKLVGFAMPLEPSLDQRVRRERRADHRGCCSGVRRPNRLTTRESPALLEVPSADSSKRIPDTRTALPTAGSDRDRSSRCPIDREIAAMATK